MKKQINMKEMARKGGNATKKKYGKDHFSIIGKKGGNATKKKYGKDHFSIIGKKGRRTPPRD